MLRAFALASLALLLSSPALAEDAPATGWDAFADERRGDCVGAVGKLDAPIELAIGAHKYRLEGARMVQLDQDKDDVLRVGIISAIKDDRPETQEAVRGFMKRFEQAGMDVLICNGDLATTEFEMETMFPILAEAKVPVIALIGNTESCGSFNRAASETFKKHSNFINGNWVRRIELDDGTLLTLPGYYDRKFAHTGGAARYKDTDLEALKDLGKDAPAPRILVSHGPPHMNGKTGIDVATDAGNVGDPAMSELIKDLSIPFGLFGHILEAGGRATDLTGKPQAPNAWHPALYVNAGTANPDPWRMLDGSTSWGMAMMVEIKGKQARFKVDKLAQPKAKPAGAD